MAANKAPRFQIEIIHDRKLVETVRRRNTEKQNPESEHFGHNFIMETVERIIPESYMVYFPGQHSVWFETKAAMAQAGIVEDENFEIDLDTGLPIDPKVIINLKAHVEKNTKRRAMR